MALGLIAGGAIGNIYDRMRQGAVTDFIDLHLGAWHWPTFNTADIAIVVGAAILIADSFHSAPRQPAG
jgi:signal peptidase II